VPSSQLRGAVAPMRMPVKDMVAQGLARFACDASHPYGCQAVLLTTAGERRFFGDAPAQPTTAPRAVAVRAIPMHCYPGPCPTPLPTLPPAPAWLPHAMAPSDFHNAYSLPIHGGSGKTVAVIEGGHDPNLEHDLDIYREQFGIPVCRTSSGCLRIVNDVGTTNYPADIGDYEETALDVDMVSAICQDCNILVVEFEATGLLSPWDVVQELGKATDTAVQLGANAVSISYAEDEFDVRSPDFSISTELAAISPHFNHPGVVLTASSGDAGFNGGTPQFQEPIGISNLRNPLPADIPTVIAVGGTSLTPDSGASRGWDEIAWPDSGSGCSPNVDNTILREAPTLGFQIPTFQTQNYCSGMREIPDISFAANISPGAAIYYTAPNCPTCEDWYVAGGTSEGSPAVAAIAMLDAIPNAPWPGLKQLYAAHAIAPQFFWDITSGSNSTLSCMPAILCNAGPGFDGPTGLGSPNGMHAFDPFF
jgi:subtilase family serine protease